MNKFGGKLSWKQHKVEYIALMMLSGMWVGLLYMMLNMIINLSKKKDKSKKQIISLSLISFIFILSLIPTFFMILVFFALLGFRGTYIRIIKKG